MPLMPVKIPYVDNKQGIKVGWACTCPGPSLATPLRLWLQLSQRLWV